MTFKKIIIIAHCKEIVNEKNLKCFAIRDNKFKINRYMLEI
jgi:hypothetical protein